MKHLLAEKDWNGFFGFVLRENIKPMEAAKAVFDALDSESQVEFFEHLLETQSFFLRRWNLLFRLEKSILHLAEKEEQA
jgi:hypothetical protein